MKYALLVFLGMLMPVYGFSRIEKIFESDTLFRAPESIAYDSINQVLYVSNYSGALKEGQSYGDHTITKIDMEGNILDKDFIGGLSSPTGICIHDRKLFIVERFGVVEYDLTSDRINNKYYIKTNDFLNDITLDPEGNIYVTVSGTSRIYRISNGEVEIWLEHGDINNPNGILWHEGRIIVGTTSDGCLKRIDPQTKEIALLAHLGEQVVDGIRPCGTGYLASLFEGNLFWVSPEGEVRELLNTRDEGLFLADFEYIESKSLLYVPALWNNKIFIYKLLITE